MMPMSLGTDLLLEEEDTSVTIMEQVLTRVGEEVGERLGEVGERLGGGGEGGAGGEGG